MLSCENWIWRQLPKWDVSILLEDSSEWDLGVVKAVLKPSGEVKVVCKCSVLENLFFVWNKRDHSSSILNYACFAGKVICCFGKVFDLTATTI